MTRHLVGLVADLSVVADTSACADSLPCNAEGVLHISSSGKITTFGGPWTGAEKWEGGVMADNGIIYGIPQEATQVLRINPAATPPKSPKASKPRIQQNQQKDDIAKNA